MILCLLNKVICRLLINKLNHGHTNDMLANVINIQSKIKMMIQRKKYRVSQSVMYHNSDQFRHQETLWMFLELRPTFQIAKTTLNKLKKKKNVYRQSELYNAVQLVESEKTEKIRNSHQRVFIWPSCANDHWTNCP